MLTSDGELLELGVFDLLECRAGELFVLFDHYLAVVIEPIVVGTLASIKLGIEMEIDSVSLSKADGFVIVEILKKLFNRVPEGFQQHGYVKLSTTVDAHIKNIFMVKLEVEPGSTVRNNPSRIEELATGVGRPFIMIEENTGRTVQLANHNPFRAIDDETSLLSHERDFTEVYFLFLYVFDITSLGLLIDIPDFKR